MNYCGDVKIRSGIGPQDHLNYNHYGRKQLMLNESIFPISKTKTSHVIYSRYTWPLDSYTEST